jgi:succinate dehydrogenase / fumarate reductase flavoprotein subunit
MQGLADGYFILPYTIGQYFASMKREPVTTDHPEFKKAEQDLKTQIDRLLSVRGKKTTLAIHRELGKVMWDYCGMARSDASLRKALARIPELREEFKNNVDVTGSAADFNQALEQAGRVSDYLEFAELLCQDALHRKESCGGHFREEYQTEEGEARRDDANFSHVAAWEYAGAGKPEVLNKEPLVFENVHLQQRSYK